MSAGSWTWFNPVRVVFGPGSLSRLPELAGGSRIALVTTAGFNRRGVVAGIEKTLGSRLVAIVDDVEPNPDLRSIESQAERVRAVRPEMLVALGGGSVIDSAKAMSRLLTVRPGTGLRSLLSGEAAPDARALPLLAVPTTAGTGAEVTPFGTVWDYREKKKYSVVGDDLFPKIAVLDPELTLPMPREVTITSGLDAISHALESTWNRNATPVSLGLAMRSLQLSTRALPVVHENPDDLESRTAMMQASLLAGLAISQSRTALAHAISYPLTANFNVPHGLACSFTLPALLAFNSAADDGRLTELSRGLGYSTPDALARSLSALFADLGVGALLGKYVSDRASALALTDRMFAPGRAENNLRNASEAEVRQLVTDALTSLGI